MTNQEQTIQINENSWHAWLIQKAYDRFVLRNIPDSCSYVKMVMTSILRLLFMTITILFVIGMLCFTFYQLLFLLPYLFLFIPQVIGLTWFNTDVYSIVSTLLSGISPFTLKTVDDYIIALFASMVVNMVTFSYIAVVALRFLPKRKKRGKMHNNSTYELMKTRFVDKMCKRIEIVDNNGPIV